MSIEESTQAPEMNNTSNDSNFSCLNSDISHTNITDQEFWKIREEFRSVAAPVVVAIISLFFVVAFTWNLFIIITFFVRYRLLKEPANILLLNLAIADFLVALITMVFSIITMATREFIFGSSDVVRCGFCDSLGVIFMTLIAVSIHSLAVLSIDRFILLSFPLKYKSISTPCRAVTVVIAVWCLALLISIPPTFGFGEIEFNRFFGFCIPRFTGGNNFFYVVFIVIEYLVPIITLVVTNIWTVKIVLKFLKRNLVRRQTYRRGKERKADSSNYHKQQTQLVKVFGALLISHIITWSPVIIVVMVIAVFEEAENILPQIYIFGWICYLTNPVIHPMIESFFVKDLRYQVRKAKREVGKSLRRAGSTIYRKASQLTFASEALDAANASMDESVAASTTTSRYSNRRLNRMRRINTDTGMEPETDLVSLGQLTPDMLRGKNNAVAAMTRSPKDSPRPPPERRITFHGITAVNRFELADVKMSPLLTVTRPKPKEEDEHTFIPNERHEQEESSSSSNTEEPEVFETVTPQNCNGVAATATTTGSQELSEGVEQDSGV